ncbi:MAG: AI-2E family transporter [Vicinamibacterales bacterium]
MQPRADPILRISLAVIATVAVFWWLRAASSLLIPVVLAICISYALEPLVAFGARYVPRIAAATVLLLVLTGALLWGAYSMRDDAATVIDSLPRAAARLRDAVEATGDDGLLGRVRQTLAELRQVGGSSGAADRESAGSSETATRDPADGRAARDAAPEPPASQASPPAALVQQGVSSGVTLLGHVVTVFFLVFFLLAAGDHFSRRLVQLAREDEQRRTLARIVRDINGQIQRFLLVRLATAALVALATWGVLAWLETPQAGVWAILAGAFNSIPYFGPVIVSGGLFAVGLVQSGELWTAFQMAGAALAITSLEGWLLTPPLLGKTERMSATVIFLGLLLWTWIWGAWGTLLAVPMLVVIKAVADHVEALRPVGRLMDP